MLHDNEVVNIEEDMILSPGYLTRIFTLNNQVNHLKISITNIGATIISCKINNGKDEIIKCAENDVGNLANPLARNGQFHLNPSSMGFDWHSHVLGLDTLILGTSPLHNSTITYHLNSVNILFMVGKLRNVNHLANLSPFYFNLNDSIGSASVDGHFLQIRAINLDYPEKVLPVSVLGETNLFYFTGTYPGRVNWQPSYEKRVFDLLYTLNESSKNICLKATLSYGARKLEVTLQNVVESNQHSAFVNNQNNNLCKFKVKIAEYGISITPCLMTEFKCMFKLNF